MKKDLVAAAKVQRGFIPEKLPSIPGFRFSWMFEPSEYVGGDLLNIIRLDETHWAFYVLDVSGHGVPAALLSVSLSRMIDQISLDKSAAKGEERLDNLIDPIRLVESLNRRFPGGQMTFCTLLYAILDTQDASVTWVRAGHEPPLLVKRDGLTSQYFREPGGFCVSKISFDDQAQETKKLFLEPGDRFILFSDGITEAMKDYNEFGYERLDDTVRKAIDKPLEDSLKDLIQSASEWTGSQKFADDVTLLALERIPE